MSSLAHPHVPQPIRSHWILTATVLAGLLATIAIVLVLTLDNGSSTFGTESAVRSQPSVRVDGGPEETSVAASVGAARSGQDRPVRPDESSVAAAISGR